MVGIAGFLQPLAYHRTPCSWPSHTSTLPSWFWRQRGWQEEMKTWGRPCGQCQAESVASLSHEQDAESLCIYRYRCHPEIILLLVLSKSIPLYFVWHISRSITTISRSRSPSSCLNFLGQHRSFLGPRSRFQAASPCTSGHPQWARPHTSAASQLRLLRGKNKASGFTAQLALPSLSGIYFFILFFLFFFFFWLPTLVQERNVNVCLF